MTNLFVNDKKKRPLFVRRKNVQQTAVASQSRSTELFISIFKYSKINLNKFFRFKLQMLDKIIIIFSSGIIHLN